VGGFINLGKTERRTALKRNHAKKDKSKVYSMGMGTAMGVLAASRRLPVLNSWGLFRHTATGQSANPP